MNVRVLVCMLLGRARGSVVRGLLSLVVHKMPSPTPKPSKIFQNSNMETCGVGGVLNELTLSNLLFYTMLRLPNE
jgi:hypothetical protein